MFNRPLAALVGGALAACVLAAPAGAAPTWKPVTPPQDNLTQVGLARTADGTLHLAWPTPTGAGADLMTSTIAKTGAPGAASPITQGWTELGQPALLATGNELHVYFAGNHGDNPDDPLTGLDHATAPSSGSGWTIGTRVDPTGSPAYVSDIAAIEPGGVPLESYSGQGGVFVHVGLDPAAGPFGEYEQSQLGACCGSDANLALDAKSGAVTLAWASNAPGHEGIYVQAVNPANGQFGGSRVLLSGTAHVNKTTSRVGLVARPGGGTYSIYPIGTAFHKQVRVWKVGGGSATVATSGNDHSEATLATTPDGRLWAVYEETFNGSKNVVEARRSNRAGSVWGAVVTMNPPHGVGDLNHLEANGQKSPVDVLAHYTSAGSDRARTYATQLLPGITVTVKVSKSGKVSVKTLDAGDKLGGVKIAWGSHAKTTSKKKATLTFTAKLGSKASKLTLTATKKGYTPAKTSVKLPASGK